MFRRLFFISIALFALAGCGPSEETREQAQKELQSFVDQIDFKKFNGLYKFWKISFVDLRNTGDRKSAGLSVHILQLDRDPNAKSDSVKKPQGFDWRKRVLKHSDQFYKRQFCPPADYIAKYGEEFRIRIVVLSQKYSWNGGITCN